MGLFDLKRPEAQEQSEQDAKIAAHVKKLVEESRASSNRVASEAIWMENTASICGFPNARFDSRTRSFQPVNRVGSSVKQNRSQVNKLLPNVQNRLARLCKNPPKYDVRPESNDTEDKEAARLATQTAITMWDKLGLNEKRIPLYMLLQQCGHSWAFVGWDPTEGNPMPDPTTGKIAFEGDIRVDIASAFEVFVDPTAKTFDDIRKTWVIRTKVRKLDYFKANFPEKGQLVKEEDAWLLSAQYEGRINSLNSRGPSGGGAQEAMKNCAIEMVKYEARSSEYPMGRMITVASGITLEDKPLPVGEIPARMFCDTIIGGKLFPETPVTHARPLQDSYNENEEKIKEWTRNFLSGKYKAARGSGLAQESLHNGGSEVVYFNVVPNAPNGPEAIQVPVLPQWAWQRRESLDKDISEIMGISEVSKGTLPSASIPAIGMQLLTEQDDTRIGVMTEQHEHAWAGILSLILKYVEFGYKIPRKLKMAGHGLEYCVKEISGDMLRGNTDVSVVRGSMQPGSKTLANNEIMNRYDRGLLGPQQDPKVIEKVNAMTEFGDMQELFQDYGLDMSQIKRGIQKLEQGQPVQADKMDNHPMWIQELNRYRKGDKWEALDPGIKQLFNATIVAHVDWMIDMSTPPAPLPVEAPPGDPNADPNAAPDTLQEPLPAAEGM